MRNAECGVWNAECGMRSVECGVWNAECGEAAHRSKLHMFFAKFTDFTPCRHAGMWRNLFDFGDSTLRGPFLL
jgi:hypothetical protein